MKKILNYFLVLVLLLGILTLTGCGKKENETEKNKDIDYANSTADDLLSKIKDKENVTKDELVWLISTYSNVNIKDDFTLEDNITTEALSKISSSNKPNLSEYLEDLLNSDSPQVRGYGISLIPSLTGVTKENLELAKNLIAKEENPYVLYCATKALSNEAKSAKEVGDFLLKMSENDNAKIREASAYALGNSWSKGLDGATEAIIKLMNDEDINVRKAACRSAGKLEDEAVIDPLVKILNDEASADIHGECIDGLVTLWYDYPFFEKTSEKAYNATMDYFRKTPRTEKIPAWTAVGAFKTTSTQASFTEWKQKATYFNTDELYNIMVDIIKDGNANWLARSAAIDEIKSHCSDEKFKELKGVVDGLTDDKASQLKSAYEGKAK